MLRSLSHLKCFFGLKRIVDLRHYMLRHQERNEKKGKPQNQLEETQQQRLRRINESSRRDVPSEEQLLNYQLKTCIRSKEVYRLYIRNALKVSPRFTASMLIKLIIIRKREQIDEVSFVNFVKEVENKITMFTPEDLIRILHCLKKERSQGAGMVPLKPLIHLILNQFGATKDHEKEVLDSLRVISTESSLKLLHSITYIYGKSGPQFAESIRNLSAAILRYLCGSLTKRPQNKEKTLDRLHKFYRSLIEVANMHNMNYVLIFQLLRRLFLEQSRISLSQAMKIHTQIYRCGKLRDNFLAARVRPFTDYTQNYLRRCIVVINFHFRKQEVLIEAAPYQIIQYIKKINSLEKSTIVALEMTHYLEETVFNLTKSLRTLLEIYDTKDFKNATQKKAASAWLDAGNKENVELIYEFLKTVHAIHKREVINVNIKEYNLLISYLCSRFSSLRYSCQCMLVQIAIERKFSNTKELIVKLFEGRGDMGRKSVEAFTNFFEHWKAIQSITSNEITPAFQQEYFQYFLRNIHNFTHLERLAFQVSIYVGDNPDKLSELFKPFIKYSLQNCIFSNKHLEIIEANCEKWNKETSFLPKTYDLAFSFLQDYFFLQQNIRVRIMYALNSLTFMILLLENLSRKFSPSLKDVTKHDLFAYMLQLFEEEFKCLYFPGLLTINNIDMILDICEYLERRGYDLNQYTFGRMRNLKSVEMRKKQLINHVISQRKKLPSTKASTPNAEGCLLSQQFISSTFVQYVYGENLGLLALDSQEEADYFNSYLNLKKCAIELLGVRIEARYLLQQPLP